MNVALILKTKTGLKCSGKPPSCAGSGQGQDRGASAVIALFQFVVGQHGREIFATDGDSGARHAATKRLNLRGARLRPILSVLGAGKPNTVHRHRSPAALEHCSTERLPQLKRSHALPCSSPSSGAVASRNRAPARGPPRPRCVAPLRRRTAAQHACMHAAPAGCSTLAGSG